MSEHNIEVGETVRLKSGGPLMTYEGPTAMTGEAICTWFDGSKKVQNTFNHKSIEKAEKPKPSSAQIRRS